jgi:hypothetical protein
MSGVLRRGESRRRLVSGVSTSLHRMMQSQSIEVLRLMRPCSSHRSRRRLRSASVSEPTYVVVLATGAGRYFVRVAGRAQAATRVVRRGGPRNAA